MAGRSGTAFERSIDILLMFGDRPEGVSAKDIADRFDVSRSSAFRYLQALRARNLIEPADAPGLFRLGPALVDLAARRTNHRSLAEIAKPLMRDLAVATGESVLLTRRVGDRVVVLVSIDSDRMIRVRIEAAQDSPLHVGSFGKLHMAYLDEAELDDLLAAPLRSTVTSEPIDATRLRAELDQVRNRGFAVSEGEIEVGMSSISVPVLDGQGGLIAALSVAGPLFRLPQTSVTTLVRQLADTARLIADDLHPQRPERVPHDLTRGAV